MDEPSNCYRFRPYGHVNFYGVQEMCRGTSSAGSLQSPMSREAKEWGVLQDAIGYLLIAYDGMQIWDGIFSPTASREPEELYIDGSQVSQTFWSRTDPWPFRDEEHYYRNSPRAYKSAAFTHENCMTWKYQDNTKLHIGKPKQPHEDYPAVCKSKIIAILKTIQLSS